MPYRTLPALMILAAASLNAGSAGAQTLTIDEFRRELVGLPLCGTPTTGPLAGKPLCTVHLPDGTAVRLRSLAAVRFQWFSDRLTELTPESTGSSG